MCKTWDNTTYSCHICKNQKDCTVRKDLHEFLHKNEVSWKFNGLHIYLETDVAKYCNQFKV